MGEILQGWKDCVEALARRGIRKNMQTLRNWHHYRLKMPFVKDWPNPFSRFEISLEDFLKWYDEVKKIPRR